MSKVLTHADNVAIYEDTRKIALLPSSNFMIAPTIKYEIESDSALSSDTIYKVSDESISARISVVPTDSFTTAHSLSLELQKLGVAEKVLVLNLANGTIPGGGVSYGSFSQEENLFRRSNYFITLLQDLYPISSGKGKKNNDALLYSPIVTVFKDENYNLMTNPFQVSCIAVAAAFKPKKIITEEVIEDYGNDGRTEETENKKKETRKVERFANSTHDKEVMRKKIDSIFRIAILHKHRNLVLGALGCGAYHNPVDDVIELFNDAIQQFDMFFDNIIFAVRSHKDGNYEAFKAGISTNF